MMLARLRSIQQRKFCCDVFAIACNNDDAASFVVD